MAAQTRAVQDLSRTLERLEKDRKGLQRPARPPTSARSSRGHPDPPPTQVLQRPARPPARARSSRGLPSRPQQTQGLRRLWQSDRRIR
ncbi:unnamed protein product [Gadus morhua 'NCC']